MTGAWYSQPFRPDGGITAEGLRNQLGRPALSLPTVLVRESAQNSWDARDERTRSIEFSLELATVSPARIEAWRRLLSAGSPAVDDTLFPLRGLLRGTGLRYLVVADRGTKGLGGPTRSDRTAEPGSRNWLSFVLNSGEARDTEGGGGTYGYGKGVFFLASAVGTVLIHTRFRDDEGRLRTRFIGSSLWASYTRDDRPFTGRHWWGLPEGDHCEPLLDDEADRAVAALGLPAFAGEATGTTVTILDPDLKDPSVPEDEAPRFPPKDAGRYLADAIAWNLWPLTLHGRRQRLVPRVLVDHEPVAVPGEDDDPVIASFAQAYRRLGTNDGEDVECKRPRRTLGRVAVERTFAARTSSKAAADLGLVEDLGTGESPHHACLLRSPELVVRYLPGPTTAHPDIGYAAVLRIGDDLDHVFAKSEPPTHDAWIDSQLSGHDATFVRMAHRRIKEHLEDASGARRRTYDIGERPVTGVAQRLGHLLTGMSPGQTGVGGSGIPTAPVAAVTSGGFNSLLGGGSAGRSATGSGSGSGGGAGRGAHTAGARRGLGRPRLDGVPRFASTETGDVIEQDVRLPSAGRFTADVAVVTGDGKLETEPFAGAAVPVVIGWRSEGGTFHQGPWLSVEGPCDVVLLVRPVPDAALDISVAAVAT